MLGFIMSSMKYSYEIAFYEAFEEEADKLRHYLPDPSVAFFTEKTIQDESHEKSVAPVISVRTQSVIPLTWASHIDAIISRSTGYDHLLRYKNDTGVNVQAGNLPHYCSRAVAEQCMLLWMTLLRKLRQQMSALDKFDRNYLTGKETKGRNLSVFGVGQIGCEVVNIGLSLGMNVVGVDVDAKHDHINYVSSDEALAQADIIVCAMNLTNENHSYFNDNAWEKVCPGAVFINVSRGELSPMVGLYKALESSLLSGIALDVYNEESNIAGFLRKTSFNPTKELEAFKILKDHPDVIMTPHNAFNTEEAVEQKAEQSVIQFLSLKETGNLRWLI
jgi:D-lactate dehydrogenase